jgi:transcriptional regulator with XRE-family HTH domain
LAQMKAEDIGTKIRIERKKSKLTLEQLARKVGISSITLHRIETGKSSPSVITLSEIANAINKPIFSFFEKKGKTFIHIKRKNQHSVSSSNAKGILIGPRRMITDNIVVIYGELKKGKSLDCHTNPGVEWVYHTEGKCEFTLNGQSFIVEAGDSISYNARMEHSVKALEPLKYFSIIVEEEEKE